MMQIKLPKIKGSTLKIKENTLKINKLVYIKSLLYGLGILAVVVAVQMVVNRSFQNEGKMVDAFAGADSKVVKSELQIVGSFGNKYMTKEDKEELIDYLSGKLGIEGKVDKKIAEGNKTTSITANVSGDTSNTSIESISVDYTNNNVTETTQYIYVTITIYQDINSILHYKNIVEKAYQEMGLRDTNTSLTFEGEYNQMLSLEKKNEITNAILMILQGKVVRDNRSDQMYTVYAYTPMVDDYISVEKNRVNVNIAFSYDETEKKTMLYMASPVINTDY